MSHTPGGYDRPNLKWTCGLTDDADPCSVGPTCHGRCPKLGECVPLRDGDRWVCNRSPNRGGPCPDGPGPDGRCCLTRSCTPQRSLRSVRGRWIAGAAFLTIGVLLMLLGSGRRNELIVPGGLTTHHAQVIARGEWSNRCAACHPGANDKIGAWVGAALLGEAHDGTTQSDLCLDCHRDMATAPAAPLLAHGLPTEALPKRERITSQAATASLVSFAAPGSPAHGGDASDPLACAACHQEHHGAGHDLAALTDARCQACHVERFDSFAEDHPDFGVWPTTRRTRIRFNHASHQAKHYTKANRGFDCRACHQVDSTGDLTARPDYQHACAECHDTDLVSSFGEGLPFLALPTIDREALADAAPAAWPEAALGDFDGDLPAFTKLLLAADPAANAAMERLGHDFSFFDLDAGEPADLAASAALTDALLRLLEEVQEEGHGAIATRLGELTGRDAAMADLVARLPVELIDRIQATWLGDRAPPEPFDAIEDRTAGGGWRVEDDRLQLTYRPTGHDDPFLRAWLDAIAALPPERAALRDACLAEFSRPGAPGGCLECHSVEQAGDLLTINWRGRDRLNEPRGFTKFSHRPHLIQPELATCTHCHQLDPQREATVGYTGNDPHRFSSEFVTLSKSACVECHRPHAAGDRCTQCHNYHVDPQ